MGKTATLLPFAFGDWLAAHHLTWAAATKVFAVSRRTVAYWARNARISGPALVIVRTVERQSAPWAASAGRGLASICHQLAPEWRREIVGALASDGDWRTWLYRESPTAKAYRREHAKRVALARHVEQLRAAEQRRERLRCRRAAPRPAVRDLGRPPPQPAVLPAWPLRRWVLDVADHLPARPAVLQGWPAPSGVAVA